MQILPPGIDRAWARYSLRQINFFYALAEELRWEEFKPHALLKGVKKDDLKDPDFGLNEEDPRLKELHAAGPLTAHEEFEALKKMLGSKPTRPIPKAPPPGVDL